MPVNKTKIEDVLTIDAQGVYYRELNKQIREELKKGCKRFRLKNVNGQRYIGTGLVGNDVVIEVEGVPGNDLGAFMDGPTLVISGNAQDGIANTMNEGKIIIHGDAGDVLGYGMRGGKLFVKGDVGYRVGIHMKEYKTKVPVIIAGGVAGDFLGEYMAGGILILLGHRAEGVPLAGDYLGTGMHNGVVYLKSNEDIEEYRLGQEISLLELTDEDNKLLDTLLKEYCADFKLDFDKTRQGRFLKYKAISSRPYGKLYAY